MIRHSFRRSASSRSDCCPDIYHWARLHAARIRYRIATLPSSCQRVIAGATRAKVDEKGACHDARSRMDGGKLLNQPIRRFMSYEAGCVCRIQRTPHVRFKRTSLGRCAACKLEEASYLRALIQEKLQDGKAIRRKCCVCNVNPVSRICQLEIS